MLLTKKRKTLANSSNIRIINPHNPDMAIIQEAVSVIRSGGVVIFPTRHLYGLGADAFQAKPIERIYQMKQRPENKPVSILIQSRHFLEQAVMDIPPAAIKLMDVFWPGKITLVFNARPEISSRLTAGTGKIGVRVPEHPTAVALIRMLDHPITATSANISGMPGAHRIDGLPQDFINQASLVLDAGLLKGGKGSTVVDVTVEPPRVLREGEISKKEIYFHALYGV